MNFEQAKPGAIAADGGQGPYHGGDMTWARAKYADAPEPWIDLSTGINPWAYPFHEPPAESYRALPDRGVSARLEEAASRCYRAAPGARVVPAPGSQALIQWLPRLRPPGRVCILSPTYGEHAPSWRRAGHDVALVATAEALEEADVAVVVNPNNPDGRTLSPGHLDGLGDRLAARGGWLVVDEAFCDLMPDQSLAGSCDRPGRVVLRSFGKFFGLAGVRVGFALAGPGIAGPLAAAIGPWAVANPAARIATQALEDRDWIAATRQMLKGQAKTLDGMLEKAGLNIVGGTSLFRLARHDRAGAVLDHLLRHGLFVRHFPERRDWLRFGLGDEAGTIRLREALSAL